MVWEGLSGVHGKMINNCTFWYHLMSLFRSIVTRCRWSKLDAVHRPASMTTSTKLKCHSFRNSDIVVELRVFCTKCRIQIVKLGSVVQACHQTVSTKPPGIDRRNAKCTFYRNGFPIRVQVDLWNCHFISKDWEWNLAKWWKWCLKFPFDFRHWDFRWCESVCEFQSAKSKWNYGFDSNRSISAGKHATVMAYTLWLRFSLFLNFAFPKWSLLSSSNLILDFASAWKNVYQWQHA